MRPQRVSTGGLEGLLYQVSKATNRRYRRTPIGFYWKPRIYFNRSQSNTVFRGMRRASNYGNLKKVYGRPQRVLKKYSKRTSIRTPKELLLKDTNGRQRIDIFLRDPKRRMYRSKIAYVDV